jgi:hypothetical protein
LILAFGFGLGLGFFFGSCLGIGFGFCLIYGFFSTSTFSSSKINYSVESSINETLISGSLIPDI